MNCSCDLSGFCDCDFAIFHVLCSYCYRQRRGLALLPVHVIDYSTHQNYFQRLFKFIFRLHGNGYNSNRQVLATQDKEQKPLASAFTLHRDMSRAWKVGTKGFFAFQAAKRRLMRRLMRKVGKSCGAHRTSCRRSVPATFFQPPTVRARIDTANGPAWAAPDKHAPRNDQPLTIQTW